MKKKYFIILITLISILMVSCTTIEDKPTPENIEVSITTSNISLYVDDVETINYELDSDLEHNATYDIVEGDEYISLYENIITGVKSGNAKIKISVSNKEGALKLFSESIIIEITVLRKIPTFSDLTDDELALGQYYDGLNKYRIPEDVAWNKLQNRLNILSFNESYVETFENSFLDSKIFPYKSDKGASFQFIDENIINDKSLLINSSGNYKGVFFNGMKFANNGLYKVSIDYKVIEGNTDFFVQFRSLTKGSVSDVFMNIQGDKEGSYETTLLLKDYSDYEIMIFPREEALIWHIDNLTITRLPNETSKTTSGEIPKKGYVLDTFGDPANAPFNLDFAQVPNSKLISNELAIEGTSLLLESSGGYNGAYLVPNFKWTEKAKYLITFNYKILEFSDTIYFQLNENGGGTDNLFKEFGAHNEINEVKTFEWEVTLDENDNYIGQIFPGNNLDLTKVVIDNLKIERLEDEETDVPNQTLFEDDFDNGQRLFNLDPSQTPNSKIIDDGIDNKSLYFESSGSFATLFLLPNFNWTKNATYSLTFDYQLISFIDTVYFQLNGGGGSNVIFKEFGQVDELNKVKQFSWEFTLGNYDDHLIQIFPGSETGDTSLLIDNIRLELLPDDVSKTTSGEISEGDYIFESFGDLDNSPFTLDLDPVPNSLIIDTEDAIKGNSLLFESPGNYNTMYLVPKFKWTPNASYLITFDYKVLDFVDTIYFQLNDNGGGTGNLFKEFGSHDDIGDIKTFSWEVTLGNNNLYLGQFFPGGSSGTTKVIIDNLKIERLIDNTLYDNFDEGDRLFNLDTIETPNSEIINDGIDGKSLYFESEGSYATLFMLPNFNFEENETYVITFEYKLLTLVDTVYFQLNGNNGSDIQFKEFGNPEEINEIKTFTWEVTLDNYANYLIQIFPGGGVGTTSLLIDNITVNKTS